MDYPYADRFPVTRAPPRGAADRATTSWPSSPRWPREEDAFWETGKISGTMYCGDHEHYALPHRGVRGLRPRERPAARHVPLGDPVRGRDHRDGARPDARRRRSTGTRARRDGHQRRHRQHPARPAGLPRARGPARGITAPNIVKPETAHPAFDKGCHLFGIECRTVPVDPATTQVDAEAMAAAIDDNTIAIVGLGRQLPLRHHRPDRRAGGARAGAGRRPARGRLPGRLHPALRRGARLRHPAVRLPGPRRHLDLRGHPQVRLRLQGLVDAGVPRQGAAQRAVLPRGRLVGREVHVARHGGLPLGGPAGRDLGVDGARWAGRATGAYAADIFATAAAMMDVVRSHPELRLMGNPTFCFSFTSDEFDIYHVADFMRPRGWRFNGQQYPNAIHMAVTRPQTQPGVVDAFAADLAEAVAYARSGAGGRAPRPSSGAIYGGVAGGLTTRGRGVHRDGHGRDARRAAGGPAAVDRVTARP